MAISTAASRTIGTSELLELILSHLPPRDLLLAQRTSKTWSTFISTSPTLQVLLYFRASATPSSPKDYIINPLLQSAFPFIFNPGHVVSEKEAADWDIRFGHLENPPDPSPALVDTPKVFLYSSVALNTEAWTRKDASWRRMLITSPPVKRVVLRHAYSGQDDYLALDCVVGFGEMAGCAGPECLHAHSEAQHLRETKDPHVQLDGEDIDLSTEPGLRMAMLYDHLQESTCTGDWPERFSMQFSTTYPSLETIDPWNVTLIEDGDGDGKGLTLVVSLFWSRCCAGLHDEAYPQFKSKSHTILDVGPWVTVDSKTWLDSDSDL